MNNSCDYYYTVYESILRSPKPLPELVAHACSEPHIIITYGEIDPIASETEIEYFGYRIDSENEITITFKTLGSIKVYQGKEIIISPLPSTTWRQFRQLILGLGLAVIIFQQGSIPLHASAVEINDKAAIFVGPPGAGKSTLAAALYRRGHNLIDDDVVAIRIDDHGVCRALPGFPRLKLLPQSVQPALGRHPSELEPIVESHPKVMFQVPDRIARNPIPVGGIFLLDFESQINLRSLTALESLPILVGNHVYAAVFGNSTQSTARSTQLFRQCTDLLRSELVFLLERPRSLDSLGDVANLLERFLSTRSSPVNSFLGMLEQSS